MPLLGWLSINSLFIILKKDKVTLVICKKMPGIHLQTTCVGSAVHSPADWLIGYELDNFARIGGKKERAKRATNTIVHVLNKTTLS